MKLVNVGKQKKRCGRWLALAAALWIVPMGVSATQVRIFKSSGASDFLSGELDGISLDALGRLRLSQAMELVARPEEPFLFTAVAHGDGWLLGTGTDGKVLRVSADGTTEVFFDAEESQVFALWADPDGTVFAGTSPNGKVYRISKDGSSPQEFFAPGETYIWALARGADGRLLVATGTRGRLFAVGSGGQGEVILDITDPHLRTVAPAADGSILVGTAGEGLLLRLAKNGRVQTLHDAPQPEIIALTAGPDGTFYAAALASEASQVDLTGGSGSPASSAEEEESEEDKDSSSKSEKSVFDGTGSRPSNFKGWRSEVFKILPSGAVESLYGFQDETVYSLLWDKDRLWVGTGQEGHLYSYRGDGMVLEKKSDERQIVALLSGTHGPVFAATNTAALYQAVAGDERKGTYLSRVFDAGAPARFGSFRWWGEAGKRTTLQVSLRSGLSAKPDATWTDWSAATADRDVPLADLAMGRYIQWRVEMEGDKGATPRLDVIELSYRQRNSRPRIQDLAVLEPGQILVPSNFNPSQQIFEPAHPSRQGIFTTLKGSSSSGEGRLKPLWKLGYRSLRWKAEDPNKDKLRFDLSFQPMAGAGTGEWLTMTEELEGEHYSFDATVLPDGVYRFRLVASDEESNDEADALTAERISGPVVVDHSAPFLLSAKRQGGVVEAQVRDTLNPIREAMVSIDAGEWVPARAADGLVDGRRETLRVEAPTGTRLLLLRLMDAAHNVVTLDLMKELQ